MGCGEHIAFWIVCWPHQLLLDRGRYCAVVHLLHEQHTAAHWHTMAACGCCVAQAHAYLPRRQGCCSACACMELRSCCWVHSPEPHHCRQWQWRSSGLCVGMEGTRGEGHSAHTYRRSGQSRWWHGWHVRAQQKAVSWLANACLVGTHSQGRRGSPVACSTVRCMCGWQ